MVHLRDGYFYLVKLEDFGRYDDDAKKSSVLACCSTSTDATKFARREAKRIYRRAEDDSFKYPDPPDEGYDPYYSAEIMLRNEHLAIKTAYIKVEKVRCRTAFHPEASQVRPILPLTTTMTTILMKNLPETRSPKTHPRKTLIMNPHLVPRPHLVQQQYQLLPQ
jgi:hypothetical protein